ncbi:MAG TPA: hypothetical protein GX731_10905 [Clostridiales bacterium]|nr:hypothetical protein [Clostridiales bacterium]
MNKIEYLNSLREALEGELNPLDIENNIRYYDEYIGNRSIDDVEKILGELGDPRLIAKSIIEADRAAKQKDGMGHQSYQDAYYKRTDNASQSYPNNRRTEPTWYNKLFLYGIIVLIVMLIIFLGTIMMKVLFTVGIPILIIIVLIQLFRNR